MPVKLAISQALQSPIINLPQKNYNFESIMMDVLPAHPIKTVCGFFESGPSLDALSKLLAFYRNNASCEPSSYHENIRSGWTTLSCRQLAMPLLNGKGSIFATSNETKYDWASKIDFCKHVRGLTPDPEFVARNFDVTKSSNIAFVNGGYDPWLAGCIVK